MKAPLPDNEASRLRTLELYQVLDTAAEKQYDDLAELAATICQVPICLISLVDEDRQWFKSRIGLEAQETPREFAFCAHAIVQDEMLVIPDATRDSRFADNPLVVGDPKIRFYAGAQLRVANGESLGTLCVIDRQPRILNDYQLHALDVLRQSVVSLLEMRRALRDLSVLSQCLPVCAWCRSVRGIDGTWLTPQEYLGSMSNLSHGVCPACKVSMLPANRPPQKATPPH